jgi:NADH dehydrogenase/NADH:ubiquinone oxidoreductase subunit G
MINHPLDCPVSRAGECDLQVKVSNTVNRKPAIERKRTFEPGILAKYSATHEPLHFMLPLCDGC